MEEAPAAEPTTVEVSVAQPGHERGAGGGGHVAKIGLGGSMLGRAAVNMFNVFSGQLRR